MRLRITNCIMLLLLLAFVGCRSSEPARIGTTAPDFTVSDGTKNIELAQLRGRPVLLVFWATWCPPCVQETPALVALKQQMGDKLVIFAVSMDEDADAYQSFASKRMPGILTARDAEHKSSSMYGTFAYPESFLIGKDGKIVRKFIGAEEWTSPEMLDYFQKL